MGIDIHDGRAAQPMAGAYVSRARRLISVGGSVRLVGPKYASWQRCCRASWGWPGGVVKAQIQQRPLYKPDEVLVEVRGEVPTPGMYAVSAPVTVQRAVVKAGGTLNAADGSLALDGFSRGRLLDRRSSNDGRSTRRRPTVGGQHRDTEVASGASWCRCDPSSGHRGSTESEHGPFGSVEELERVHGIGPKTVDALRSFVIVQAPSEGRSAFCTVAAVARSVVRKHVVVAGNAPGETTFDEPREVRRSWCAATGCTLAGSSE